MALPCKAFSPLAQAPGCMGCKRARQAEVFKRTANTGAEEQVHATVRLCRAPNFAVQKLQSNGCTNQLTLSSVLCSGKLARNGRPAPFCLKFALPDTSRCQTSPIQPVAQLSTPRVSLQSNSKQATHQRTCPLACGLRTTLYTRYSMQRACCAAFGKSQPTSLRRSCQCAMPMVQKQRRQQHDQL